jgi:hypothetical protein
MEELIGCIMIFVFLSAATTGLVTWLGALPSQSERYSLIQECEKGMPRNEHCKLIAVPDIKEVK